MDVCFDHALCKGNGRHDEQDHVRASACSDNDVARTGHVPDRPLRPLLAALEPGELERRSTMLGPACGQRPRLRRGCPPACARHARMHVALPASAVPGRAGTAARAGRDSGRVRKCDFGAKKFKFRSSPQTTSRLRFLPLLVCPTRRRRKRRRSISFWRSSQAPLRLP